MGAPHAAAGLALLGGLFSPHPLTGPDPYAGCTAGGEHGTVYAGAALARDAAARGRAVAAIVQQDPWSDGGARGLLAAYSRDGGRRFHLSQVPFSSCARGGLDYERASLGWVSFGPDGTLYAVGVGMDAGDARAGVVAAVSRDGGRTWRHAATLSATDDARYQVLTASVTADPRRPGTAYAVWNRRDTGPSGDLFTATAEMAVTRDGGRTWSAPRVLTDPGADHVAAGSLIVADPRTGVLHHFVNVVGFTPQHQPDRGWYYVSRSGDGGRTWSDPAKVAEDTNGFYDADPNTGAPLSTAGGLFDAAIDPRDGTLYMAFQGGDYTGAEYDQAELVRSGDGGATWSAPVLVSKDLSKPAVVPTIAVAGDGTVGVTYYDFRDLPPDDRTTLPTTPWLATSRDHGATFTERRIAPDFDFLKAPAIKKLPYVGSYEGLVAWRGGFRAVFTVVPPTGGAAVEATAVPRSSAQG